ncbi:MAG: tyrosine-type recombinase/integrase, partial [Actinobacteria bacterium]|nr:tyrosine-type recombinase/integrase [Actinomycetota bacterium]
MSVVTVPDHPHLEAVQQYMCTKSHLPPKHHRAKMSVIVKFVSSLGERALVTATAQDVEAWLDSTPLSVETRRQRRGTVGAFFTWAVENRLITANPIPARVPAPSGRSGFRVIAERVSRTDSDEEGADLYELGLSYVSFRVRRGDMTLVTARNTLVTLNTFADSYGRRELHHLGPEHVEHWLDTKRNVSLNTRRTELGRLRPFLNWLTRRGHLGWDPGPDVAPIKVPKRLPHHITTSDVVALLASCPDPRATLIVLCQVQLGLRCAEVAALRLDDISFADRTVRVHGKGGRERLLPIDEETWFALAAYLHDRSGRSGPLIRHQSGGMGPDVHINPATLSVLVRKWMVLAKIKQGPRDGAAAHSLRHTACVDMLRRGGHIRDVQTAMGHAKLETTAWYLPM